MSLTIAIDVDGVVCDLLPAWLALYNADYGDDLTPEEITDWGMEPFVKPECGAKIYDLLRDPALYAIAYPIAGALLGVRALRGRGHRVVFVTSTPIGQEGVKLRWLQKYGFLTVSVHTCPDYVEATDKSLIRADVLIDDYPVNVVAFSAWGTAILFDQPHNRRSVWPRARSWAEVVALIDGLTMRHP